jgi:hypothetical protein
VYAEGRTASVADALTISLVRGSDTSTVRGTVASVHAIDSDDNITKLDRFMVPPGGHEFMMKTAQKVVRQPITKRSCVMLTAAL